MHLPPFESLTDLQVFLSNSSKEQFQKYLSLFSLAELAESWDFLQNPSILEAKKKFNLLFEHVDSAHTLENLGKHFSVSSFMSFLDFLIQHPKYQNRLTFIL